MSLKKLTYLSKNSIWTISEAVKMPVKKSKVFWDVKVGNKEAKRITFELFDDVCPRTAYYFSKLCQGTLKGTQGNNLNIKDIKFDTIIPSLYVLGGSITGSEFFNENYAVSHDQPGLLSLVHTNDTTKFLITLGDLTWFDQKYTVFGKVVDGLDVLNEVERCGSIEGKVSTPVTIENCGSL